MKKKELARLGLYLFVEIGIEFKACLYFFCILFFYSMYRIAGGNWEASILHMMEMIFTTYGMGYVQMYLMSNFDEGERLGKKEFCYVLLCSGFYTLVAVLGNWYDGSVIMAGCFFLFMILSYVCAFLVYKIKRNLDSKVLNAELKAFQERVTTEE